MDIPSNALTPRLDRDPSPWGPPHGSRPEESPLRRLRTMPLTEIAYRSWQEASKWLERVSPVAREVDPEKWLRTLAPELAHPEAALQLIRERVPRRFFAGVADTATASALDARLPHARREIVTAADALLERRFDLLGYHGLWFGDPIDWHLDPVWSRRAPLAHWSRLDPLDPIVVGDSKIVWELNRHQWLVRLAQAWAVTGDERYAAACIHTIDAWRGANPPGVGINWTSSLEVSYRLVSWCWTALLIRDAPMVSGQWMMTLLVAIWQHANHIRRYLSYYFSPNTHLTGEALGLFYAGTLFPEFRDAAQWRSVGTRVLLDESRSQLSSDGVHFEQSTCYHGYTVETYLHLLLLATRNRVALPRELVERVGQMVEFLVAVRRPDGSIPAIGDGDNGVLVPLVGRQRGDRRGVFAVAAAVFDRPDFAWAAEGAAPELLWLMGIAGLQAFDAVRPAPPSAFSDEASRVFPSGGYGVMRSGWGPDAHQLIVDVGPLGCPTSSGHGHADLLSVQCAIFGEACLVDAGTYCYTTERPWRDFFRSTAAHSTVLVDGLDQAESAGPFRWHQHPRARLLSWQSEPDRDVLDADHDAYQRLADPVTCRRRVIFVKPDYWLLVDDLGGTSNHQVDVTFQFAPAMRVTLGPHSWARAETPGGRVLWTLSIPSSPVQRSLKCGEADPIRGWVSSDYGQRQPAPMLVYSSIVTLPWRTLTLLLPDSEGFAAPPVVTPVYDEEGRPTGLTFEPPRRSVRVEDRTVVITG
jgi:Heparinase II/III-like protein/Heparinase II/III N-terminus